MLILKEYSKLQHTCNNIAFGIHCLLYGLEADAGRLKSGNAYLSMEFE